MENKKQEFLEITTIGKRIGLQTLGDYKGYFYVFERRT